MSDDTTKQDWTPEPWQVSEPFDGYTDVFGNEYRAFIGKLQEENAARIVLCVNALTGISNETLAGLAPGRLKALLESEAGK